MNIRSGLVVVIVMSLLMLPTTFAVADATNTQATGAMDNSVKPEPQETKVFRLQHADANDAAKSIMRVLDCRVGVDERTNVVVLSGDSAEIHRAADLLQQLDVPSGEGTQSAMIRVGHDSPGELMSMIHTLVSPQTRIAFDRESDLLVVRGQAKDLDEVRKLVDVLQQTDEDDEPHVTESLQVRYYFIQAQYDPDSGEAGGVLPEQLSKVAKVLPEVGLHNPTLLASMIVHVESDALFNMSGSVGQYEGHIDINVEGIATLQGENRALLETDVKMARFSVKRQQSPLLQSSSEFTTPIGDFVVLTASPASTDEGDAIALVLQIVRVN